MNLDLNQILRFGKDNIDLSRKVWGYIVTVTSLITCHLVGYLSSFPPEMYGLIDSTFLIGFLFSATIFWIAAGILARALLAFARILLLYYHAGVPSPAILANPRLIQVFLRSLRRRRLSLFLSFVVRLRDPSENWYWSYLEPTRLILTISVFGWLYVGVKFALITVCLVLAWIAVLVPSLLIGMEDKVRAGHLTPAISWNFFEEYRNTRLIPATLSALVVASALLGFFRHEVISQGLPMCLRFDQQNRLVKIIGKTANGVLVQGPLVDESRSSIGEEGSHVGTNNLTSSVVATIVVHQFIPFDLGPVFDDGPCRSI